MLKRATIFFKNFENDFSISKATFIIAFATLLTKCVSLLRVNLFASRFAAGDLADVYFSSFRIPDFIFNLLILGTLSVAFIPLYVQVRVKNKQASLKFANSVLNLASLAMLCVIAVVYVCLPWLTHWLLPGFSSEKLSQTVSLSRIFLLSPLIFTVSNVISSVLTSHKRFLWISLAPTFYNLGIIIGIVWLYPVFGLSGLGFGVVLGALFHLIVQLPELYKVGFRYRLVLFDQHCRKFFTLFLPRIFAFDSSNVSLLVGSFLGSSLSTGSVAIFNYAFDLQSVPLGIFAFSIAAAAFPVLTSAHAKGDVEEYTVTLVRSMVKILFYVIPISLTILVLRAQIVRILLGHGNFGWEETILTFQALGIFSLSLSAQALIPMLSRSFYARQNTITPVVIGIVSMAVNITLSYLLHFKYGVVGIAIGFSASNALNCLLLLVSLRFGYMKTFPLRLLEDSFDNYLVSSVTRIVITSGVMGLVLYGMLRFFALGLEPNTTVKLALQVASSCVVGGGVYLFLGHKFALDETLVLMSAIKRGYKAIKLSLSRKHA